MAPWRTAEASQRSCRILAENTPPCTKYRIVVLMANGPVGQGNNLLRKFGKPCFKVKESHECPRSPTGMERDCSVSSRAQWIFPWVDHSELRLQHIFWLSSERNLHFIFASHVLSALDLRNVRLASISAAPTNEPLMICVAIWEHSQCRLCITYNHISVSVACL